jgi:2-polyprenyl-3-methyl-5-hydroxy-6-metoxy-1,4-benzoquinol methylase
MRPCPVCDNPSSGPPVDEIDADKVWTALREEYGVDVPQAVRARHATTGSWSLMRCPSCGLEHFPDAPQGDAEFYALLMGSECDYEVDRWEFRQVGRRIPSTASVIDLGCGEGWFLRGLPASVRRTGLDHNGPALAALHEADPRIDVVQGDAAQHAVNVGQQYDVVTAFQILEHIEQPRRLLAAGRALVRPDGSFYVSIPHLDRSGRRGFEVLDSPPHHLTRWRAAQLEKAAEREALRVVTMWYEPPDESLRMETLNEVGHAALRWLPRSMARQSLRAFRRLADTAIVRERLVHSGYYERRGCSGHTLLARLEPR